MNRQRRSTGTMLVAFCVAFGLGCEPSSPQTTDSQTNWLSECRIDEQCGPFSCLCGVCTNACTGDDGCADLPGASCVVAGDPGSIARCGGSLPTSAGLCLPRCEDSACPSGQMCVADVCTPVPQSSSEIRIETARRYQTLTGYGASVAYVEDEITSHPRGPALQQALFGDLGLDVLRFRNRYATPGDDDLTIASELIDAAAASLGRVPSVFLTSWSPPASMKANAALQCSGNQPTCTLIRGTNGFDYGAYAAYWRQSIDAYLAVGIVPDYIGLQNNPNWSPTSAELGEACRFLPVEGMGTVLQGGVETSALFPGFAEAQAAVLSAFDGLATVPKILAPETSDVGSVADYAAVLDIATVDALSHHLYGADPLNFDSADMTELGALAAEQERPIFQTEMTADGFGTAVLTHYATAVEGASAYLQAMLVGSASGPAASPSALVGLTANDFTLQDPYYALRHFALHTDPGWVRVDAQSSDVRLLSSAWLSPAEDALTVIVVNTGMAPISAELAIAGFTITSSEVRRTVFDGVERFANLGQLSTEGVLEIPGRAIVTMALAR